MIFVFKQKTAYEMRISDWSSDVCSSDLIGDVLTNNVLLPLLQIAQPQHIAFLEHPAAQPHAAQQHRGAVAVDDLGAACMEKALCLRRRAGQAQQQCGGDQTKRHHSGSPLLRGYSLGFSRSERSHISPRARRMAYHLATLALC